MSDYTSWHVGMKVVCVDAEGVDRLLSVGAVYTISALAPRFVTFAEPSTWSSAGVGESGWYYHRFRRVQTRRTSIAIFERIRDNPKAPIIEPSPKQRERAS